MRLTDFHFDLPDELIARYPEPERSKSRLLVLDGASGELAHHHFYDLPGLVEPGDLLVFNNTRVIPARLFGRKESGGKVEILIERLVDSRQALAYVRASRSPKAGTRLLLENGAACEVTGRHDDLFRLQLEAGDWLPLLDAVGHMPLPPYIDRDDELEDRERYQTVYGERAGAVAAPTAGLHFDQVLLDRLEQAGIDSCFVTLHVGAGTFSPVRVDDITEHTMHSETFEVSEEVCDKVRATRARGGRVIAVGTTSVRCLESASRNGDIEPAQGETDIFIYPGYRFRSVDGLITNFHLPESTLILLVSAFAGREHILDAYRAAIAGRYRFFSYGDAMFITCANPEMPDAEGGAT